VNQGKDAHGLKHEINGTLAALIYAACLAIAVMSAVISDNNFNKTREEGTEARNLVKPVAHAGFAIAFVVLSIAVIMMVRAK
jgi:hypothetical protein